MTKAVKRKPARRAARAEAKEGKPRPDPIFAAIKRHRTALLARWVAQGIYGQTRPNAARHEEIKARADKAWDREYEALEALIACPPTTADGLVALITYVGQPEDDEPHSDTIIGGAIQSNCITGTAWSRRLSRAAAGITRSLGHP
jgi:hypothetical protein